MQIMRRAGRKITFELVDDLDGSVAGETVSFELDGTSYEIDLSTKNAEEFRSALRQYIDQAEMGDLDELFPRSSRYEDGLEGREGEFSDY
jgi:hypothetical protein